MQYPLGEHEREQIASKTGKKLDEITLDAVMRNQIAPDDIKISKDKLRPNRSTKLELVLMAQ